MPARRLTLKQRRKRSSTRKNYKSRRLTRKKLFVCKRRLRKQRGGVGIIHRTDPADTAVVKVLDGVSTVMSEETYKRDYAEGKVDHVGDI